jgi:hypothetical protein
VWWLANGPVIASISPVVYLLCISVVTAVCFKDILIVGSELFQFQGFSGTGILAALVSEALQVTTLLGIVALCYIMLQHEFS